MPKAAMTTLATVNTSLRASGIDKTCARSTTNVVLRGGCSWSIPAAITRNSARTCSSVALGARRPTSVSQLACVFSYTSSPDSSGRDASVAKYDAAS